jgi:protein-S-isoprenylcysteine O-methyltransferase Ste14
MSVQITRIYLDGLWAALTLGLALGIVSNAGASLDYELVLYLAIHLATVILYLIRRPTISRSPSSLSYVVACLSTTYVYLYDFNRTAVPEFTLGRAVMFIGLALSLFSLLSLGRCFGVLPISRGVQTAWMYRAVRHPIYASYILMDIGLVASYRSAWNVFLFFIGLSLYVLRINYEELLLQRFTDYREYMTRVRFRLLPLIY